MSELITETKAAPEPVEPILTWKDSPSAQRVLDAICQIIVMEYAAVAKEHPETFLVKK